MTGSRREPTAAPQRELPTEHRDILRSISGLLLAIFVASLSTNILATALPRILVSLRTDVTRYTWVVTVYLLMLTVSVPLWGRLADLFDNKRLLHVVVGLYVLSSLVAGTAGSWAVLIVARGVQGLGTGGLAALGQVLLASIIAPRERGRYNGYSGAVVAAGTLGGPLVGGLLVDTPGLGWRACFLATIPFGLLAALLIERRLVTAPRPGIRPRLDVMGAVLLVCASGLLISWCSLLGVDLRLSSPTTLAVLAVVVVLSTAFVAVELRRRDPLVPLRTLRLAVMSSTSVASFCTGAIAFATPLFLAQYFQLGRGLSPVASGLATLPAIIGIFSASWIVGRLITATGRMKPYLVLGAVAQLGGVLGLAVWMGSGWLPGVQLATFAVGFGIGSLQQNLTLLAQNVIPPREMGSGTAIVQFSRFMGGAIGLAVGGAIASQRVLAHVSAGLVGTDRAGVTAAGVPNLEALSGSLRATFESGYARGLADLFALLLPLALVPLVLVCLLRDVQLSRTLRTAELD